VLTEARKETGLSQTKLGERLTVGQPWVAKIENGDRHLRVIELPELCLALGLRMVEFIGRFEREIRLAARPMVKTEGVPRWRAP
jgi:transcriptional regulator with XRE-family HTH domain